MNDQTTLATSAPPNGTPDRDISESRIAAAVEAAYLLDVKRR